MMEALIANFVICGFAGSAGPEVAGSASRRPGRTDEVAALAVPVTSWCTFWCVGCPIRTEYSIPVGVSATALPLPLDAASRKDVPIKSIQTNRWIHEGFTGLSVIIVAGSTHRNRYDRAGFSVPGETGLAGHWIRNSFTIQSIPILALWAIVDFPGETTGVSVPGLARGTRR